jgi:hypothetical protein
MLCIPTMLQECTYTFVPNMETTGYLIEEPHPLVPRLGVSRCLSHHLKVTQAQKAQSGS